MYVDHSVSPPLFVYVFRNLVFFATHHFFLGLMADANKGVGLWYRRMRDRRIASWAREGVEESSDRGERGVEERRIRSSSDCIRVHLGDRLWRRSQAGC